MLRNNFEVMYCKKLLLLLHVEKFVLLRHFRDGLF